MPFPAKLVASCLVLFAVGASAADSDGVVPHPLAPSPGKNGSANAAAKPGAMTRVTSPVISETSVTRREDGSLVVNCVDKPNPQAQAAIKRVRDAQAGAPQQ